jgi:hypothetical protein
MDELPITESGALKMPSPFSKTKKTGYGYIENIAVSTAKYKKIVKPGLFPDTGFYTGRPSVPSIAKEAYA